MVGIQVANKTFKINLNSRIHQRVGANLLFHRTKFYAVRKGRQSGIFQSWDECSKQVVGYKTAEYKSFKDIMDAENYLKFESEILKVSEVHQYSSNLAFNDAKRLSNIRNKDHLGHNLQDSQTLNVEEKFEDKCKKEFRIPVVTQLYNMGFFVSEDLIRENGNPNMYVGGFVHSFVSIDIESDYYIGEITFPINYPGTNKIKFKKHSKYGTVVIFGNYREKNIPNEIYKLIKKAEYVQKEPIFRVYTDGASKGNQFKDQRRAGYGVFFGDYDSRNTYGKIEGEQTNQRAELIAIYHALKQIKFEIESEKIRYYMIASDSKYSILCLTKWFKKWELNNWLNANGAAVEHKDVIQSCLKLIRWINVKYHALGLNPIQLEHVRGHNGNYGNEMADKLANKGCEV